VGWENQSFSSFKREYSENGKRYVQSYYYRGSQYALSIDTKIDDFG